MNKKIAPHLLLKIILILLISAGPAAARAQPILDKTLSVEFRQQDLGRVLEILSNKGDFYFSYNSAIMKKDSLVTLSAQNKTIRQILDLLFHGNFEYKESGNYIILRRAPARSPPAMSPPPATTRKYTVNGIILDEATGERLSQASVYDKQDLIATLTDENGVFIVKLKNRPGPAALTVSKESYEDTTVLIPRNAGPPVTIIISPVEYARSAVTIGPGDYLLPDPTRVESQSASGIARVTYIKKDLIRVEMTPFGKLLLSSRLKIQSINLKKFFAVRRYQVSLLPEFGTNGFLGPQIVNKFSLNIIGGYTGGLNGMELGGFFNIDKQQVRGFQAAGFLNIAGGPVRGLQIAGFHNTVLDSMNGWQLAGFSNFNRKKLTGFQEAGFYNHLADSLHGAQIAGFANFSGKHTHGVQIAGLANVTLGGTQGAQIAGLVNYTRRLKGVQIAVINIADTSEGYSFGLINLIRKGTHSLSFFADEISPLHFAFRSGNAKLYSIFLAGLNPGDGNRAYYYGFGLGHQFKIGRDVSLNPELSSERVAPGSWDNFRYANLLNKLRLDMHWRLGKYFSLSGGPSLAIYYADHDYIKNGHVILLTPDGYPRFSLSGRTSSWIGWQAGINFL